MAGSSQLTILTAAFVVIVAALWISNPRNGEAPSFDWWLTRPSPSPSPHAPTPAAPVSDPSPPSATPSTAPLPAAAGTDAGKACLALLSPSSPLHQQQIVAACGQPATVAHSPLAEQIATALWLRGRLPQSAALLELSLDWLGRAIELETAEAAAAEGSQLAQLYNRQGGMLLQLGRSEAAVAALERGLGLDLRLGQQGAQSVEAMLLHSAEQASEDLVWIADMGSRVIDQLQLLLRAAEQAHRLPLANAVYKVREGDG